MKLAVALLLVTSQLNVQVQFAKAEVSCDDKDVFRAVDVALTEYNNRKTSGNQFVLHQIITASLKESGHRTFTLTYNMQEGDCPVKMGKNWKECGIKTDLKKDYGQCTTIVKSQNESGFIVTEQHCEIIPVNEEVIPIIAPCLGCYKPIAANDENLEAVLNNAIQQFNYKSQSDHLYALKEVLKVLRQVVRGWNYDLEFTILKTDCVKREVKNLTSACKPLPQGNTMACRGFSHVTPQMKINSYLLTCETEADSQFSDTQYTSVFSPELKEPLRAALENLNSENKSDFYFKPSILRAQHLVEPEEKHSLEIQVKETECSKEKGMFSEDCEFKKDGRVFKCMVDITMEQEGKVKPVIDCQESLPLMVLMKRPSGFSPFRASVEIPKEEIIAIRESQKVNTTKQEEVQTPGKGAGYPQGNRHGWQREHHPVHWNKNHPGFGLAYQWGNSHTHGHKGHRGHKRHRGYGKHDSHWNKHKRGKGHSKHKEEDTTHDGLTDMHPYSPTEENFLYLSMEKESQSPPPPHRSHQGIAVTPSYFQDLDLLAPNPTNIPVEPTEKTGGEDAEEEYRIPDIPFESTSPFFALVPDFPEPVVPKCPGSLWQPITVMNGVTEESQDENIDLSDAL